MTESRSATPGPGPELSTLPSAIAAAVTAAPGVARLVPGLRGALARLRRPDAGSSDDSAPGGPKGLTGTADGVTVVEDGDRLRVVIDIGVHADAVVIDTARAARSAAQDVVTAAHPGPSSVRVNVLAREAEDSPAR